MKVVIIHGNGGGTCDDHWQPWLENELNNLGVEVVNRTMPDNVAAKSSVWLPFMKNELKIDDQTIIVGHSSGAVAAMRFAESHKIKGSVLVGVCYTDLNDESEKASGYYDKPWQWQNIRSNQDFNVVIASRDDPWISIDEPRYIQDQLQGEYHEYPNKGHFMSEHMNGRTDFPELLQILKNYLV
jgi:predicted alpha/beta hydrolase family esterase